MININPATKKIFWTKHAQEKMKHYQLSESRVKRVLRHPLRLEKGIAEKTVAAMQSAGSKAHPYEIWMMYQTTNEQIKVISAWRYPGTTKPGDKIPIPEDILSELDGNNYKL